MIIRKGLLLLLLLAALVVGACGSHEPTGDVEATTSQGSGLVMDGARVASIGDTYICVDPESQARECFRVTEHSQIPPGMTKDDTVALTTLGGVVVKVIEQKGSQG
jgi:hypothetical protein